MDKWGAAIPCISYHGFCLQIACQSLCINACHGCQWPILGASMHAMAASGLCRFIIAFHGKEWTLQCPMPIMGLGLGQFFLSNRPSSKRVSALRATSKHG